MKKQNSVDLGQVFTKKIIADYMVSLFCLSKNASLLDPCCGDGAFLESLEKSGYGNVTAYEIDKSFFDSTKKKYSQYLLLNEDVLKSSLSKKYDGIIMNPPYIRQEKINDLKDYGITKETLHQISIFKKLPKTSNMYMYFVIKAIDMLVDKGQLVVVFPSSWLNTKTGEKFKKIMLSKCGVEKKIHVFGEVFEKKALVDVIILKLVKGNINISVEEELLEAKAGRLNPVVVKEKSIFNTFLCPFSKLATLKRGVTTGCNEMYINPHVSNDKWVKPIISSPKSIYGYTTLNARLDKVLFLSNDIMSNEVNVYLNFWKNKIIREKKPKTLYSKINNSEQWYELRNTCGKGIIFSYFVRNDMKFIMNEIDVLVRDNFYIITPKIDKIILFALLNNYYTYYQLELSGKKYGAGLLKLQKYDIERLTFPDYELISKMDRMKLEELSQQLLETNNMSLVKDITKLISKYSSVSYNEIVEKYLLIKSSRLEAY